MKRTIYFLFIMIPCIMGCETNLVNEECACLPSNQITIKSGTQYGFCFGYCFRELTIDNSLETKYIKRSLHQDKSEFPDVIEVGTISEDRYKTMIQNLNQSGFFALEDTLSDCLDCADQGAEWIEVTIANTTKKVVFDAGADVKEMESLVAQLRELREAYD